MAKYIIDIDDEYAKDWINETPMCKELCMPISVPNRQRTYHVITGFKLEPYTEPDRKAIEDEVWEFATTCIKMDGADSVDVFGDFSPNSFTKYSYQEAKAKYKVWKMRTDDIHVGDEVIFGERRGAVVGLEGDGVYIVWSDGRTVYMDRADILKTGKFFEWVEEFMEKMRGEIE